MLSPEARARKARIHTTCIFLLCCATSLFAFVANQVQGVTQVTTQWSGDALVIQDFSESAVVTHFSYSRNYQEIIAELPFPGSVSDVMVQRYAGDDLKALKWRNASGEEFQPPSPGEEVRAIYYVKDTSRFAPEMVR